jgi:hypothetical protein
MGLRDGMERTEYFGMPLTLGGQVDDTCGCTLEERVSGKLVITFTTTSRQLRCYERSTRLTGSGERCFRCSAGKYHEDAASMLYCGLGQPEKSANTTYPLETNGIESLKGPLPLAFRVEGYVGARMKVLRAILQVDEKKYLSVIS